MIKYTKRKTVMKKKIQVASMVVLSCTLLSSCGSIQDFSDYQENAYCRTNVNAISAAKYPQIGLIKQIQPYIRKADGSYSCENILKVYPFDTNLIYAMYASKDLHRGKDVMALESIIGEFTFKTHALFDRHYYYLAEDGTPIQNLKVVNDNYGGDWITVDEDLYSVLKIAAEATKLSDGKFNMFIGELSDYWDYYINEVNANWDFPNETIDPAQSETGIQEIASLVENTPQAEDVDSVLEFDDATGSVRFNRYKDKTVSITLGGIGKGYLTEELYQKFCAAGKTNGVLYAGSSSIITMDKYAYDGNWTIQLSNPYGVFYSPVGSLVFNEKMAVSTSGAQVNYYYAYVGDELVLRHHIIDAVTGYPMQYYNQVTLISSTISSAVMDTLSTVLINCAPEEIEAYIRLFRQRYDGDLECVLYTRATDEAGEKKVDVLVSKGLKDRNIFVEYQEDGSSYSIPCSYSYLDF